MILPANSVTEGYKNNVENKKLGRKVEIELNVERLLFISIAIVQLEFHRCVIFFLFPL